MPYLRSAGYHFQPRFDFRHTGLGHTLRLAKWVLGYVLVTQLALIVVNKVATAATIQQGGGGGLAAYGYAYAIWILPHSLITVSLATAMLPSASRLAAAGDLPGVADETTRTMRLALSVLVPTSVAFVVLGLPIARLIFGFGTGCRGLAVHRLRVDGARLGLVPFTLQYVCLRAFYALENTRTPFLIQIVYRRRERDHRGRRRGRAGLRAAGGRRAGRWATPWRTCWGRGSPSGGCRRRCPPWPCGPSSP